MAEKDPNLALNVDIADLSSLSLDELDSESETNTNQTNTGDVGESPTTNSIEDSMSDQGSSVVNENVFLDNGEGSDSEHPVLDKGDNLGRYLRILFFAWFMAFLGVIVIVFAYSFSVYIREASKMSVDFKYESYVDSYKSKLGKVKELLGIDYISNYQSPKGGKGQTVSAVNNIINATDIDYIDKKELLKGYVKNLVSDVQDKVRYTEELKEKIAKQGFLPAELETLLAEDEAIDTIQRSLNALEVVKFSTATRVFSYMNTALVTISEMIRMNSVTVENLKNLFIQLNGRGEKDITSYVYMCYLNPFETTANCDTIGDLDLYYNLLRDDSINIKLFKNSMNAINQLLENGDATLFSITFNGFNAQQKNISFNIEVYTNQEDEKVLMAQGQMNPNIFILTNIINLLKQSSFIIGSEINTKEINVDLRTINRGNISKTVHYSNMDFTVPIQKDTEREIFDYIDFESIEKILNIGSYKQDVTENVKKSEDVTTNQIARDASGEIEIDT